MAIALEGPPFGHDDTLIMEVARNYIGGWDNSQGLSTWHVNPLAVAASYFTQSYKAFNIIYKDTSLWGIHFVAEPLEQENMLSNILHSLMKLCTCITEKEVERAKYEMKSHLLYETASNYGIGILIGKMFLYSDVAFDLHETLIKIDSVTAKDVRETCTQYIYDRCPAVAAVGPVEGLLDYTRIRAGMYWLRL